MAVPLDLLCLKLVLTARWKQTRLPGDGVMSRRRVMKHEQSSENRRDVQWTPPLNIKNPVLDVARPSKSFIRTGSTQAAQNRDASSPLANLAFC